MNKGCVTDEERRAWWQQIRAQIDCRAPPRTSSERTPSPKTPAVRTSTPSQSSQGRPKKARAVNARNIAAARTAITTALSLFPNEDQVGVLQAAIAATPLKAALQQSPTSYDSMMVHDLATTVQSLGHNSIMRPEMIGMFKTAPASHVAECFNRSERTVYRARKCSHNLLQEMTAIPQVHSGYQDHDRIYEVQQFWFGICESSAHLVFPDLSSTLAYPHVPSPLVHADLSPPVSM
jgi:hypothetical protein